MLAISLCCRGVVLQTTLTHLCLKEPFLYCFYFALVTTSAAVSPAVPAVLLVPWVPAVRADQVRPPGRVARVDRLSPGI